MMFSVLTAAAAAALAPVPAMTIDWWSPVYDPPGSGLAAGEISLVVAEMTVNQRGSVADCVGRVHMGNPQMGPYVCSRLRKRATFKPARAPDGSKVTGVFRKLIINANIYKDSIKFTPPRYGIVVSRPTSELSHNPFEIQFYLDASGAVSDCSLIEKVGINLEREAQVVEPKLVDAACAAVVTEMKPVPPRDKRGVAYPTVQNALVTARGLSTPSN